MVEVRVEGLNRMRLLNALKGGEITAYRVRMLGSAELRFFVKRKDLNKAVAILETMCYNYSVIGVADGENRQKILLRIPIAVACLVLTVLVFLSNFFIWRIEIDGADGAVLAKARQAIAACGVREFSPKNAVDLSGIATALRHTEGIASASVAVQGNVLRVSVLTNEQSERPPIAEGDLVSEYDGVVTRVIAESGTPLVFPGDLVKRGDPLLTGELYATSDGSVIGRTEAKGRVYATVTFAYSMPVVSDEELVPTGNIATVTTVGLFGLTIGEKEAPFPLFEKSVTREKLDPLPIEVTRIEYRELVATDASGETAKFMEEKGNELAVIYGTEFEARSDVVMQNGIAVLKAYFTAEICIGKQ